jgi:hypothetical protein
LKNKLNTAKGLGSMAQTVEHLHGPELKTTTTKCHNPGPQHLDI